jgi:hypothetical protein
MTSTRSKFYISFLALTFQLLVIPQILSHLAHPTTAHDINATNNNVNMTNHTKGILVLFASHVNVSTIYDSFNEFKMLFGIEKHEKDVVFQQNEGM